MEQKWMCKSRDGTNLGQNGEFVVNSKYGSLQNTYLMVEFC